LLSDTKPDKIAGLALIIMQVISTLESLAVQIAFKLGSGTRVSVREIVSPAEEKRIRTNPGKSTAEKS
jgi:hypothetical protein